MMSLHFNAASGCPIKILMRILTFGIEAGRFCAALQHTEVCAGAKSVAELG
jgi:hypothetical protein